MERVIVYGIHHISFFVVNLTMFVSKFKALTGIEPFRQDDGAMRFEFPNGTAFQVREPEGKTLGNMALDKHYGKPQVFKPALIVNDIHKLTRALRGLGLPYSYRKENKNVVDFTIEGVLFHSVLLEEVESYFSV